MSLLAALLPSDLASETALLLLVVSFVTSTITAMFSLGGGMLMLAILASIFPPAVVVPVHGLVQLGSNGGRALVQRRHIAWPLVLWFGIGVVAGSFAGARFAVELPETLFRALIALFILYSAWGPLPRVEGQGPVRSVIAGTVISLVGMFIGATGPLVASHLRTLADRHTLVATHALLMTWSNLMKVAAFALFGFAFAAYLPLVLAMIATGFCGTVLGSRLLARVPEGVFRYGFKLVLTLVALQILWLALAPVFA